jgi:hypothetical protein
MCIRMPTRTALLRAAFDAAPQAARKKYNGKLPLRHAMEHGASDEIIDLLKEAYPEADDEMFNNSAKGPTEAQNPMF